MLTINGTANSFQEGLKAHQEGSLAAAIDLYLQSLRQAPSVDAYANLGVALRMQNHLEAAVVAYRKALAINPGHVQTLSNLGGAYRALGRLNEAEVILQQALELNPEFAPAHYNLGLAWMDGQAPHQAIAAFDEALRLEPGKVEAVFDRATCILQTGDLLNGFAAYESRFAYEPRLVKPYKQPRWDGSALQGRTLLIYSEQGFGDTLQFCRFIPRIEKEAGDRIILECPAVLKRLMEQVPRIDEVVILGNPLPSFDTHVSLLSLPALFRTTLETIPADFPYLKAPVSGIRLPKKSKHLKVGIVWASGHTDVGVRNRKISLSAFLPLFEMPGIEFYSLQKGEAVQELETLGLNGLIENLAPLIHDFADTAQLIIELDLLITADTAVVHLAGALNKPVWVLLPYGSEWRWLLDRNDSPWYPSVRLFRQTIPGQWEPVMRQVTQALIEDSHASQWLNQGVTHCLPSLPHYDVTHSKPLPD